MQKTLSTNKVKTTYECNENVFVIYEGTKNFWRQRLSADIYIIKHKILQILEIVYFLPHLSVEVPRVYISLPALVAILDVRDIKDKFNIRKETFIRQRREVDKNYILEKVTEDLAVAYLTSKIELPSVNESHGYQIVIDNKTHEESPRVKDSVFCTKPHNLEPLVIRHHGLISTEDFHATLQKFREDSKAAKSHNEEAVCALHPGAEGLEQVLAMKLQHDRDIKLKYSRAKCRWIRAINRVVIQNCTAKIRQRLADMENKNKAERRLVVKKDHQTIDNSLLEHRFSDSLPLLVVDSNLSQRAQSRIRRQLSRKDSLKNLSQRNTFDSTPTAPKRTLTPLPLSSHSLNCIDTSATSASDADADVADAAASACSGDQVISLPGILHGYKEKSIEQFSSMKNLVNLSIPWLNGSDDDLSSTSTNRIVLRPIAKRRSGRIIAV